MRVPLSTSSNSAEATKGTLGMRLRSCSIFVALPHYRQRANSFAAWRQTLLCRLRRSPCPLSQFSDAIAAFGHKIALSRALPVTEYQYGNPVSQNYGPAGALKSACSKLSFAIP